MKFIIVGLCLAALTCSSVQSESRIAVVPDFVSLMISFENETRTCGGTLIRPNYVLTSASCVFNEYGEKAQMVTVIFNGKNKVDRDSQKSSNIIRFQDIDYYDSNDYFGTLDDSPHNIALIKLSKKIKKTKTIDFATLDFNPTEDAYVDKNLIVCGFGNKTNAKTLQCTELLGVSRDECNGALGFIICASSTKDNNVCGGDNGGPIYVNNNGRLTQVGVYTFPPPDVRDNAKCLDGHKAAYTQIGPYFGWIKSKVDA